MKKDLLPAIQKEAAPAIRAAEALEVTAETMPEATKLLSVLNRASDALTASKELLTKPLNAALKEIRGRYKTTEDELAEGISIVRGKMSRYQTAAKAEADKEAAKIAARVKPGKGNLTPETATTKILEVAKPAAEVHTDAGVVKFKTINKVEITPLATTHASYKEKTLRQLIDLGLIVWDEVALRKHVLFETRQSMPGVRYYQEQVPENTR